MRPPPLIFYFDSLTPDEVKEFIETSVPDLVFLNNHNVGGGTKDICETKNGTMQIKIGSERCLNISYRIGQTSEASNLSLSGDDIGGLISRKTDLVDIILKASEVMVFVGMLNKKDLENFKRKVNGISKCEFIEF